MEQVIDKPDVRSDVIEEMRTLAQQGASVRTMVRYVQSELDLGSDSLLQVLWYFMKAFHLPLGEVLPIREWLGTGNDAEIDDLIGSAIARTRGGRSVL